MALGIFWFLFLQIKYFENLLESCISLYRWDLDRFCILLQLYLLLKNGNIKLASHGHLQFKFEILPFKFLFCIMQNLQIALHTPAVNWLIEHIRCAIIACKWKNLIWFDRYYDSKWFERFRSYNNSTLHMVLGVCRIWHRLSHIRLQLRIRGSLRWNVLLAWAGSLNFRCTSVSRTCFVLEYRPSP